MYVGEVGEHDERVVRDGWTYYVQTVRRPNTLARRPLSDGQGSVVGALLVGLPVELFLDWRARSNPWTVDVVRFGHVGSWNDLKPVVVHRTTLAAGEDPSSRIAELVRQVQAGAFHPTSE